MRTKKTKPPTSRPTRRTDSWTTSWKTISHLESVRFGLHQGGFVSSFCAPSKRSARPSGPVHPPPHLVLLRIRSGPPGGAGCGTERTSGSSYGKTEKQVLHNPVGTHRKRTHNSSDGFALVSVKDVERHCERCAHFPHKIVKDVKCFIQINKLFSLQRIDLRLSGFRVGRVHIFHHVFQHFSQKEEKNDDLISKKDAFPYEKSVSALAWRLGGIPPSGF